MTETDEKRWKRHFCKLLGDATIMMHYVKAGRGSAEWDERLAYSQPAYIRETVDRIYALTVLEREPSFIFLENA